MARGHVELRLTPKRWSELADDIQVSQARSELAAFGEYVLGHKPARHHREWIAALEDKSIRRLLIIAPPGHAKTNWVTTWYPVWRIGSDPDLHFCLLSNTATQAHRPSVAARDIIKKSDAYHELFPHIRPDDSKGWAEHEWFVQRANVADKDATLVAAGIFGPILGARFDELILDDCVDQENSSSPRQREKLREWIKATALSRLTPNGRIICVMARWHKHDLAATLMAMGGFRVIHMPALGYYGEGCALWPEVWSVARLEEKRGDQDSLRFEAMYQGNPTIPQGSLLKRAWFRLEEQIPAAFDYVIQIWDTAQTAEEEGAEKSSDASYSACITLGVVRNDVYILGYFKRRMGWPDLLRACYAEFRSQALRGQLPRLVLIEDKSSGTSLLQALRSGQGRAAGDPVLPVLAVPVKQSKEDRARSVLGYIEGGRVHLPVMASWSETLLDRCAAFPEEKYKDEVDALIHGLRFVFPSEQQQEVVMEYEQSEVISPDLDRADAGYGL